VNEEEEDDARRKKKRGGKRERWKKCSTTRMFNEARGARS